MPRQVQGPYPVTGVVDGDTITVDDAGTATTVRLLGIDTPETVDPDQPVQCFGAEAAERAEQLLNGQQVWLETDPSQAVLDAYGRTLAYVWLPNDQMANLQLIEEGYAREYTYDQPYRYQDTFQAAEADAIHAGRGLWPAAACPQQRQTPMDGLSTAAPARAVRLSTALAADFAQLAADRSPTQPQLTDLYASRVAGPEPGVSCWPPPTKPSRHSPLPVRLSTRPRHPARTAPALAAREMPHWCTGRKGGRQ